MPVVTPMKCAMCGLPKTETGICLHCDQVCTQRGYDKCPACESGRSFDGVGPKSRSRLV